MKQLTLLASLLLALGCITSRAQQKAAKPFTVAFYNVENLFDTIDDPLKTDEDFLPTAKVPWTADRLAKKLDHTARVIAAIDSVTLPAVVGLAEVENREVLEMLVANPLLKKANYMMILVEGEDPRGIDVAMVLRPDAVKYVSHHAFRSSVKFKTRNILYVKVTTAHRDTLHLFVNHWKSRSGGAAETEDQRVENAAAMKHLADSLLALNPKANIIIMGDLNDEPGNRSVAEVLGAVQPVTKPSAGTLYDLMYDRWKQGEGTLYYKDWDVFDQIIVSGNLLVKKRGKGSEIMPPYAYILKKEWMLYRNKSGEMVPNRTASGKEYFGGYSDHLPVYTVIR
jgi:endonuclease/exonuclease/phosphatase family metal-dependent hydrolase